MDVRGPCTPRNFRSHTSTGPRPVVLKLGSGGTARLESPKGICFSLKNKKTGGRQERQYGASRREEQTPSGSFSWPPGAAQVGPPPRPSYLEGGGTGPPTLPHSFPALLAWRRGREGGGAPSHTDFVMRTQLIESPPMPPNLHCPQSRASPLPPTAPPSQYNQSPYTGRRRQSHGQTDRHETSTELGTLSPEMSQPPLPRFLIP